jgi:hypothetical protein
MLVEVVVIILPYADDIVLMVRNLYDLGKQIRILNDFCSIMGMTMNIDKNKGYDGPKNKCLVDLWLWGKKKLLFDTLVALVILC